VLDRRCSYRVLGEELKERAYLEDPGVDEWIILKRILMLFMSVHL
jgi:hypothetical protein